MSVTTRRVAFRLKTEDIAAIDLEASQRNLTRTKYVADKLLDRLGAQGLDSRVDALEQRVQTLERRLDLGM